MKKIPSKSDFPENELTPTVCLLLTFIEQQQETIEKLQEQVDVLNCEVSRLKKLPKKPNIKPSTLPKDDEDNKDDDEPRGGHNNNSGSGKQNKPRKRKKKLTIHNSEIIKPKHVPDGSRFLGYQDYLVQDLLIQPFNIRYRLARYNTPDGESLIGTLPDAIKGSHFGPTLRAYILYQYYHQRVTQPLIKAQLGEWGVDISTGQISQILIADKERWHAEKDALLTAGIHQSSFVHVDDTGSRHEGKNGYCTHIGNDAFAWFSSTPSKSRINFLKLLCGGEVKYTANLAAFYYMRAQGLPKEIIRIIEQHKSPPYDDDQAWMQFLQQHHITSKRHIKIATEGALLGSLVANGFPLDLVIISDDAGQFNILWHALCWIHADRVFQRIVPFNEVHRKELNWVRTQIWDLYDDLKDYKNKPSKCMKQAIEAHYDELCKTKTTFATLHQALKRLAANKKELLLVLQRPDIPLHNNLSERDIREYVIKRKISGSTRSENGRRCRDTFASLKKTCLKQGVSFWEFINDRLKNQGLIPYIPDLLSGKVCIISGT